MQTSPYDLDAVDFELEVLKHSMQLHAVPDILIIVLVVQIIISTVEGLG